MVWHEYATLHTICRRLGTESADRGSQTAWYREHAMTLPDATSRAQAANEGAWIADRRPYYDVWPAVVDSLAHVALDLDASLIRLPLRQMLLRYSVGHELAAGTRRVRTIFAARQATGRGEGLALWCDVGEVRSSVPIYSYLVFALTSGRTVEHCMAALDRVETDDAAETHALWSAVVRTVVTTCLLGQDPDLVRPVVLAADEAEYEATGDARLVERAVKRGRRGWSIGRHVESSPHYRRPHFSLRWTGAGRAVPKVVPVKGSIVHRRRLAEVPTGRLDDLVCKLCGRPVASAADVWECEACAKDISRPTIVAENPQTFGVDRHRSGIGRGKTMT